MEDGVDNEITVFVFRLLVLDLLALFHVLNQALINILRMYTTSTIFLMLSTISLSHTHIHTPFPTMQATFSK